jgi:hypothetical protein
MERHEGPIQKPGDNSGNIGMHVKTDKDGEQHLNMSTLVDHLEQQTSGPHDDRASEFKKPNADKFEQGATKDTAGQAKGNERS